MVKIILILLLLLFLYFYWVSLDYKNPYKLIMVFGKKGSGKNTLLTKWSIKYNRLGWHVYSDSEIFNTYKLDTNWIGKYDFPRKSVLLVQEAGMTWDNRNFKSFPEEVRDFFKLQRHKEVMVVLASQSFDVDKKLRDLTDEMYLITNFMRIFSVAKRINKKITIQKASDTDKQTTDQASFLTESYSFDLPFFWKFTYIPRYIKYFNSFECSKLPLVQTEKYIYKNASDLYLDTHFNHYMKTQIKEFKDHLSRMVDDHSCKWSVSPFDLLPNDINFYSAFCTTLREAE